MYVNEGKSDKQVCQGKLDKSKINHKKQSIVNK